MDACHARAARRAGGRPRAGRGDDRARHAARVAGGRARARRAARGHARRRLACDRRAVERVRVDGPTAPAPKSASTGSTAAGLTRAPWRLFIAYLRAGTIDVRIAPGPSTPSTTPQDLSLPLQLRIDDLRVDHLAIHDGGSTTQLDHIALNGRSDGRHHELVLEGIDTPYGALTARAKLDGVKPFALTGDATYAGKLSDEPVDARARVSGSLEALVAEVDASGMKLNGRAHVEAAPFGAVPLTRASLAFDHVNPQALAPGAPAADLAVRAELAPVTAPAGAEPAKGFAVTGPVSIVNAKPGTLGDHLLPVIDAHANVHLDAHAQRIDDLALKLIRDGSVTGNGTLTGGKGRFDLKVANLDLNAFVAELRPMRLAGPLGVTLAGDVTTVDFNLNDPKLALGARAKVALTPQQTVLTDARVTAGKGRIDLTGVFRHDAHSSYDAKATLTAFDPLLLAAMSAPKAGRQGARQGRESAGPAWGDARVGHADGVGRIRAAGIDEGDLQARRQPVRRRAADRRRRRAAGRLAHLAEQREPVDRGQPCRPARQLRRARRPAALRRRRAAARPARLRRARRAGAGRPDRQLRAPERDGHLQGRARRRRLEPDRCRAGPRGHPRRRARRARVHGRRVRHRARLAEAEIAAREPRRHAREAHARRVGTRGGRRPRDRRDARGEWRRGRESRRDALGRHRHASCEPRHADHRAAVAADRVGRRRPRDARRDAAHARRRGDRPEVVRVRSRPDALGGR